MGILTNKEHFLHKHLNFVESTGIEGKDGGFERFLTELKISNSGKNWDDDHSTIDWNKTKKHYQFFFDYEENETEITDWLRKSELSEYEFVFTWLNWEDPIIKIKTTEFIQNWEWIYIASVEGMILTTSDGKLIIEFTDDWKHHLNSNFEIKPNSIK